MKSFKIWGVILTVMLLVGLLLVASPELAFGQEGDLTPDVDPELQAQILSDSSTGYLIYFREKADLAPAYDMDWNARGEYVVKALQDTANSSQVDIVKYLDEQKVDYQSFWIDNLIVVNASNSQTFNGLMNFPEIESLRARQMMHVIEPIIEKEENTPSAVLAVEPNLTQVNIPDVWALGITGSGMVVANIDTGVRYTHETLVSQYRGTTTGSHNYNWLGAANGDLLPTDDHGHGTHTMGTMVGEDSSQTNQIGMAPDAQWIACDGCSISGCPDAVLLTCAQWVTAPYPIGDPSSPNPAMRPHVVNNSWGSCEQVYTNWYQGSVDAWHAAGIYPVFSNGNASNCGYSSPPGLNTVGNPARYGNVTGVGSTGQSDGQYATHSNWGPTDNLDTVNPVSGWADLKPQVLAPGVNIRSSLNGSDTDYASWGGTSMSAPHVSALVTLIWQAAPCLIGNYAATETILEETATPIPYDDGTGGGAHSPNYATGWGEINSLAAVQAAQNFCGGGTLEGWVSDANTSHPILPIENANIEATLSVTQTFQTNTNAVGDYELTLPTGTYTVTAAAFGYQTETVTNVDIISGTTTRRDLELVPASFYLVSGVVTNSTTGWPLYASIEIDGYPGDPIWTNPETGYYQISLPEGTAYTFSVNAWVPGYLQENISVGPLTADATVNIGLSADQSICTAPGYEYDGFNVDFNDGLIPPSGWSIIDNEGTGVIWENLIGCGESGNFTGGSGDTACVSSDIAGVIEYDTELHTSVFDDSVTHFAYLVNYQNLAAQDFLNVDISTDGGGNWTNMLSWNEDHGGFRSTPGEQVVLDLTPYLDGTDNNIIRWHYFDPDTSDWDWYVQIDDVILGECISPSGGGLVVGNVYDSNTNDPLNGAMVENDSGASTEAVGTPFDEDVDDGFYAIYSLTGIQTLTATMSGGYSPDIDAVSVVGGDTIVHDFSLAAGMLDATPDSLYVTLDMGDSVSRTLQLENQGGISADFEISEMNDGFDPVLVSAFEPMLSTTPDAAPEIMRLADGTVDCAAYEDSILVEPAEVAAACNISTLRPSTFHVPLTPNDIGFAQDIGYISDNFVQFSLNDFPGQTVVGTSTNAYYGMDFDPSATILYALNDTDDTLGIIDLATGAYTALVPCVSPSGNWTGLTIASDGTFYASDTTNLYTIDPTTGSSTLVGAFGAGVTLMIDIAINADGQMYGHAIDTDSLYSIDLATGTATLVGLTGYNANYAQGMDFDFDDGTLYIFLYIGSGANVYGTVDLTTGVVTPLATNNPTGEFEGAIQVPTDLDVPWLSEDPITGTIAGGSLQEIEITFDAGVPEIDQPGEYFATLRVADDTPYGELNIPITMMVNAPINYGKLEGTVTGLGYCDLAPMALENAEVIITDSGGMTYTLMTDANGYYSRWYDESLSTFDIEVTYPEYQDGSASGVVVSGGLTRDVDFDLRLLEACVSIDPTNLDVTLVEGYSTTLPLDLINAGAFGTDYEIIENPSTTFMLEAPKRTVVIGDMAFSGSPNLSAEAPTPFRLAPLAPDSVTLTHSASQTITTANSVSCNAGGLHADNSYIRKFDLSTYGIDGSFEVTNVQMGIETAVGIGGTQPATINLYTWDSSTDFFFSNFTLIGTTTTSVLDQNLTILDVPVSGVVPADSYLVVEFFTPDGQTAGNSIFVGSNSLGETDYSYLAAQACGITEPTDTGTIGFPNMQLVMNVVGEIGSTDIPWLTEDPITGTLAADMTQIIDVTFDTLTYTVGTYDGMLKFKTGDPMYPKIEIPVTMHVEAVSQGVEMVAESDTLSGEPGSVVTYTVWITNTGNVPDGYDMAAGVHNWDMDMPTSMDSMVPGESHPMEVTITIPADAGDGDSDSVTITVASQSNPTETASITLTTEAIIPDQMIYLPMIYK